MEVEERQDALHARRAPHVRRQDRTRELLAHAGDDTAVVHPRGSEREGPDARGHRAGARRAVADDQRVPRAVARLAEARHVLRDLQLQRRRDHALRSEARQLIQGRGDHRRFIRRRFRLRSDNFNIGGVPFPRVAPGLWGLTA